MVAVMGVACPGREFSKVGSYGSERRDGGEGEERGLRKGAERG